MKKPEILEQIIVQAQLPKPSASQLRVLRRRAVRAAPLQSRSPAMGNGASAATAMAAAVS